MPCFMHKLQAISVRHQILHHTNLINACEAHNKLCCLSKCSWHHSFQKIWVLIPVNLFNICYSQPKFFKFVVLFLNIDSWNHSQSLVCKNNQLVRNSADQNLPAEWSRDRFYCILVSPKYRAHGLQKYANLYHGAKVSKSAFAVEWR